VRDKLDLMTGHDGLTDIGIRQATPEEAETCAINVCRLYCECPKPLKATARHASCSECREHIVYDVRDPAKPRKVCMLCAMKLMAAETD
jgi:hypothetical protein